MAKKDNRTVIGEAWAGFTKEKPTNDETGAALLLIGILSTLALVFHAPERTINTVKRLLRRGKHK